MEVTVTTLEEELASYVALQHRLGKSEYRFEDALLGHRQACIKNLRSDEDTDLWVDRIKGLDALAARSGIALAGEENLRAVLDELAERSRKRREEAIRHHRGEDAG